LKAYINGIGAVLPQEFIHSESIPDQIVDKIDKYLQIVPPDYKEYINPKDLRRMSKIVRIGLVAAKIAMKEAGVDNPDAIITGTGMGCQADTEKFLNGMIEDHETLLNPTAFIQSTHNTIGAQIALMLGNNNYNFAYVHRTFSFESALLDSLMMLNEREAENILLGGIDEVTEESWLIRTKIGYFKKEPISVFNLLNDTQAGALAGEGSAFFVLSVKLNQNSLAAITDVSTFFRPENFIETEHKIISFLSKNQLELKDIDLVISGYNGDPEFDILYKRLENSIFVEKPVAYYKHICGEFDTSSSVAMLLAAKIIQANHLPETMLINNLKPKEIRRILIYNHFRNINHSLILLEKTNL
jgi:3-oxoacyl-(acyl-carrier-protein) synthase